MVAQPIIRGIQLFFDLVRGQEGDKWKGDVEKLRDPSYGAERWSGAPKIK